jgi:hypothetical protein
MWHSFESVLPSFFALMLCDLHFGKFARKGFPWLPLASQDELGWRFCELSDVQCPGRIL